MVNKPLIRPYFWGGYVRGGYVDQPWYSSFKSCSSGFAQHPERRAWQVPRIYWHVCPSPYRSFLVVYGLLDQSEWGLRLPPSFLFAFTSVFSSIWGKGESVKSRIHHEKLRAKLKEIRLPFVMRALTGAMTRESCPKTCRFAFDLVVYPGWAKVWDILGPQESMLLLRWCQHPWANHC